MTDIGEAPDTETVQQLLSRLREQLPSALSPALITDGSSPPAGNDLFEAFLFSLVLRAARREGYAVSFEDALGRPPTRFRLRRSPGRLSTGADFTHAVLQVPGRTKDSLEVHTGVALVGKSKVAHEADVLVLPSSDAQRCRQLRIDPPSHDANLVVEGKYYTTALGLGMGRQFLGLEVDLSARYIVLAATLTSPSVVYLLEGRKKLYEFGVLPGRKAESDLQERFGIALRSYKQGR